MDCKTVKKQETCDDSLQGTGCCRHLVIKSNNLLCEKVNCQSHHNIADFLRLPYYFFKIVDDNPFVFTFGLYKKLVNIWNVCNDKKNDTSNTFFYFREIMYLIDRMKSYNKQILFIFLFKILDTPKMNFLVSKNPYIKKLIDKKLIEICKLNVKCFFSMYMRNNFETNKKYFSKEKNKKTSAIISNFYCKMIIRFK